MPKNPWPFPTSASHPPPGPAAAASAPHTVQVQRVSESALDHAVEESFPASDPVSVTTTKVVEKKAATDLRAAD